MFEANHRAQVGRELSESLKLGRRLLTSMVGKRGFESRRSRRSKCLNDEDRRASRCATPRICGHAELASSTAETEPATRCVAQQTGRLTTATDRRDRAGGSV
jgi:hypothetical protein